MKKVKSITSTRHADVLPEIASKTSLAIKSLKMICMGVPSR